MRQEQRRQRARRAQQEAALLRGKMLARCRESALRVRAGAAYAAHDHARMRAAKARQCVDFMPPLMPFFF